MQFDEIPTPDEQEVWFLPVVSLGPWVAYEALGLLLEETGKKDEFRRVGRFRASDDLAKRFFRRPTYPIEPENGQVVGGRETVMSLNDGAASPDNAVNESRTTGDAGLKSTEKRGWFRKLKKTDDSKAWREQVIAII